jgi:transposase-like protein
MSTNSIKKIAGRMVYLWRAVDAEGEVCGYNPIETSTP